MFKKLIVLLLCSGLAVGFSTSVFAVKPDEDSAVSKTFKKIGRTLRGIRDAKTADELAEILRKARGLAVENRENVPSFMQQDTDEYAAFQEGMDDFIGRIDAALSAAEAGDMNAAMEKLGAVKDAKDEFHEKFELEEDH